MPLFEIDGSDLVPFRQLRGGADLYERQIEDLLWADLEDFTGEALFPVARQPSIPAGGRPDILALDQSGRVVVIEIKREVDRGQLAQCLEYAGWARSTSLDELGSLYHGGLEAFFSGWQEFTGSSTPVVVNRRPRLVLVARDFHGRTEAALDFLIENSLPVKIIRVAIYEDKQGRRFVDVEGEHEQESTQTGGEEALRRRDSITIDGRRVRLSDLLDHGLLQVGDKLVWDRPRVGAHHRATITESGSIQLDDGRESASPSRAAAHAAGLNAYDGWTAWRVPRLGGVLLNDLRANLVRQLEESNKVSDE